MACKAVQGRGMYTELKKSEVVRRKEGIEDMFGVIFLNEVLKGRGNVFNLEKCML